MMSHSRTMALSSWKLILCPVGYLSAAVAAAAATSAPATVAAVKVVFPPILSTASQLTATAAPASTTVVATPPATPVAGTPPTVTASRGLDGGGGASLSDVVKALSGGEDFASLLGLPSSAQTSTSTSAAPAAPTQGLFSKLLAALDSPTAGSQLLNSTQDIAVIKALFGTSPIDSTAMASTYKRVADSLASLLNGSTTPSLGSRVTGAKTGAALAAELGLGNAATTSTTTSPVTSFVNSLKAVLTPTAATSVGSAFKSLLSDSSAAGNSLAQSAADFLAETNSGTSAFNGSALAKLGLLSYTPGSGAATAEAAVKQLLAGTTLPTASTLAATLKADAAKLGTAVQGASSTTQTELNAFIAKLTAEAASAKAAAQAALKTITGVSLPAATATPLKEALQKVLAHTTTLGATAGTLAQSASGTPASPVVTALKAFQAKTGSAASAASAGANTVLSKIENRASISADDLTSVLSKINTKLTSLTASSGPVAQMELSAITSGLSQASSAIAKLKSHITSVPLANIGAAHTTSVTNLTGAINKFEALIKKLGL
ncbi:MAG: hypothetical protein WDW36_004062 [Sanguina aurantia]